MAAHFSSFLLNLSVYAINRSIERSCRYYIGGGKFCGFGGDFFTRRWKCGPSARVEAEAEAAISTTS